MADPGDENISWEVTEADQDDVGGDLLAWCGIGETPQEKAFNRAKASRDVRSSALEL